MLETKTPAAKIVKQFSEYSNDSTQTDWLKLIT